ncbi:MAG: hypothetical protein NZ585_05415 [Chloracidobacterium sp.]|nr:hypothetical protein [Chloracidobacterium sp.]MDW8217643.1 hypothetical protein [Acidobacteriota bacterium]
MSKRPLDFQLGVFLLEKQDGGFEPDANVFIGACGVPLLYVVNANSVFLPMP